MGLNAHEQALLEPINKLMILDRTLEWAAVNSGTGNLAGLAVMADKLAAAFEGLPGVVELRDPDPVERVDANGNLVEIGHGRHLVVRVRPEADRRVLLTGHMDTVFAEDHPFQSCDWIDEDTLNGPGTADMKAGLSLMLAGLKAFERNGDQGERTLGYDVLINSDEETGSKSSKALIAELAQDKLAALTYEPSLPDGSMARARPGSANYSAVFHGLSAHAGRNPTDGRNAIVAASEMALRLMAASRDGMRINPAKMDGGGPDNMVPDLAILRFNIRARGEADAEEAVALVDAALAEIAQAHDVTTALHGGFGRPPKPISPQAEQLFALVRASAADIGETIGWNDTGGVCDGNNIAACGVPVIDTMGARGGKIHSADEFLLVNSLDERARLTALVLHRLETGGWG